MYTEIFVPVDNSRHSDWAVERAIELARRMRGRITANHVYAARLHDVRFRQLETGLPAQFQTPEEIKRAAQDPRQADREGAAADRGQLPRPGGRALLRGRRAAHPAAARGHQLRGDRARGEPRRGTAAGADRLRPQPRGELRRQREAARRRTGRRRWPDGRGGRGRGSPARRQLGAHLRPRGDRRSRPRPPALLAGGRCRQPRAAWHREGRARRARRALARGRAHHGLRRRLVVLVRRHAPGARAGAGVPRLALRLQRLRRRVPPRGVPQHQGRALGPGLEGLQVRGAGGAAQQHHRQGAAQALPGEPQARLRDGRGVPGRRARRPRSWSGSRSR